MKQYQVSNYVIRYVKENNRRAFRAAISNWDGTPYCNVRNSFYDKDVLDMLNNEIKNS